MTLRRHVRAELAAASQAHGHASVRPSSAGPVLAELREHFETRVFLGLPAHLQEVDMAPLALPTTPSMFVLQARLLARSARACHCQGATAMHPRAPELPVSSPASPSSWSLNVCTADRQIPIPSPSNNATGRLCRPPAAYDGALRAGRLRPAGARAALCTPPRGAGLLHHPDGAGPLGCESDLKKQKGVRLVHSPSFSWPSGRKGRCRTWAEAPLLIPRDHVWRGHSSRLQHACLRRML